jgi:hypothetical protein
MCCSENGLERCTGRGGRVVVQHMLGGLVRGDVTVRRATQEAANEGELARGAALSAYRSQHKTGGEVARTEVPVDGVLVHCRWMRHPMNAKVERRQDDRRRDVSHPDLGTADLRGMR